MLHKLTIRNFKKFEKVEIELGDPVVFIGPNNSGKTSALQALALWDIGLKRWNEKRKGKTSPEKRSGITINRRDLVAVPVPNANHLWRDLHVRQADKEQGKPVTRNIRIDIIVEGITQGKLWKCGLEFDYANDESFYCRPLRTSEVSKQERMPIPEIVDSIEIAFLPPMSGLAANETRLDEGAINVRIGEGRTAEVLRNLCYMISENNTERWDELSRHISSLFGARLGRPEYVKERGEIIMSYKENGANLDLSSSGRGLQQTLLLLAYMYSNPGAVLLLDEPDAHLEILRQRQIYQILTDVARDNGNQIIAASHSEVLLNEAADRDVVVAFLGKTPHRIDDRGSQLLKSLREIGFEHYYQAALTGWVLYLEGSTDLAILRAFARKLNHANAQKALDRPYVVYVGDVPGEVRRHFFGVREAVGDLRGIAIFDRLDRDFPDDLGAEGIMWKRREVENYFCLQEALIGYASQSGRTEGPGPLFAGKEEDIRVQAMRESIEEVTAAMETLGKGSPWDSNAKVSDDFMTPLFKKYFKKLNLPNIMDKKRFCELVEYVPKGMIDPEVIMVLDRIADLDIDEASPGQLT
jgi:energy-coupling factor transporter ATP-binding protein EcfA2